MSKKRKNKKSNEEIAREFDLPVRKSKIATIMKQDGEVYCICRSSDGSRFMICCDGCEEWYHGDCINISEKEVKHIRQFFCIRCKEVNPDLQTVFRVVPEKPQQVVSTDSNDHNLVGKKYCGSCDGCRQANCGRCNACRIRVGKKPRCQLRICLQIPGPRSAPPPPPQATQTSWTTGEAVGLSEEPHVCPGYLNERNYKGSGSKQMKSRSRPRRRKITPPPEVFINPELEGMRQCYGPVCGRNARPQSKYCSDECGVHLATARMYQVVPPRVQEWNVTPCRAESENRKQLDQIRGKQLIVTRALNELNSRQQELELVVERARHSSLDPNWSQSNNEIEDEQSMYCVTCGHEIHSRTAIKHMEKCFNKYESQASFGSIFKTRIEGNTMFCDFYNPASQTYCKRLRVLCPEHCKDPKINDNDVCGCPLVKNVFTLTGEFCRAPKKSCFKHFVWEKIRRAEIDLERVRQWIKMDELLEQERQIRAQMASRAGLLNLMLHSTYNHEFVDELCRQQFAVKQDRMAK